MNTISQIKNLRKTVGMKQFALANLVGQNQSNYANIENGKLITEKVPKIIEDAKLILLPMLDEKIFNAQLKLDCLLSTKRQFDK